MDLTFSFPHVFNPQSNAKEDAYVLRAALDFLTRVNLEYLRNHAAPSLYSSRVVYGRTREWLSIPAVLKLGFADCKSLSAWRIAEAIHRREFKIAPIPVFRWKYRGDKVSQGIKDFHVLIQTSPTEYECPSRKLGMGEENQHFARG